MDNCSLPRILSVIFLPSGQFCDIVLRRLLILCCRVVMPGMIYSISLVVFELEMKYICPACLAEYTFLSSPNHYSFAGAKACEDHIRMHSIPTLFVEYKKYDFHARMYVCLTNNVALFASSSSSQLIFKEELPG